VISWVLLSIAGSQRIMNCQGNGVLVIFFLMLLRQNAKDNDNENRGDQKKCNPQIRGFYLYGFHSAVQLYG